MYILTISSYVFVCLQIGAITNTQCPMNIGYQGLDQKTGFFRGYLDDVSCYTLFTCIR